MVIDVKTLSESDTHRSVAHRDSFGHIEEGILTSWTPDFIYVIYGWSFTKSVKTDPADLEFITEKSIEDRS